MKRSEEFEDFLSTSAYPRDALIWILWLNCGLQSKARLPLLIVAISGGTPDKRDDVVITVFVDFF